jgi:hypothetical protein
MLGLYGAIAPEAPGGGPEWSACGDSYRIVIGTACRAIVPPCRRATTSN